MTLACLAGEILLMDEYRRRALTLGSVELVKSLEADPKFLGVMRSKGALSDSDFQHINIEPVNFRRNLQLIHVLLRGTDHTFNSFLAAAHETGQRQIRSSIFTVCAGEMFTKRRLTVLATCIIA